MKYFEFSQNNSGGSFDEEKGHSIFIEAKNSDEANAIAENNGVYFNGCDSGIDCPCCGDRWYPAYCDGDGLPTKAEFPKRLEWAARWGLELKIIKHNEPMRTMTLDDVEDRG